MTRYNSLNVKLSNVQRNRLNSAIKNETDAVLRLSSSQICLVIQMKKPIFLINYC